MRPSRKQDSAVAVLLAVLGSKIVEAPATQTSIILGPMVSPPVKVSGCSTDLVEVNHSYVCVFT